MTPARASLVARIHASPTLAMLVITGGGTLALADLLAVPGASRSLLEAVVPYTSAALGAVLGSRPHQFVSVGTAAALARAAYQRAVALHAPEPAAGDRSAESVTRETPLVGLSCTAALRTDRPKRGDHRFHVGVSDATRTHVSSLTLTKDARDRLEEERLTSDVLLNVLARACGVRPILQLELRTGERLIEAAA